MSDPGRHEFDTLGSKTVVHRRDHRVARSTGCDAWWSACRSGSRRAPRRRCRRGTGRARQPGADSTSTGTRSGIGCGSCLPVCSTMPGESPVEAAARELGEETGLGADRWSVLVDVALSPGFTDEAVRVFLAEGLHEVERDDPERRRSRHRDFCAFRSTTPSTWRCAATSSMPPRYRAFSRSLPHASTGKPLRPADAPWPDRPTAFGERKSRA